jgi:hypothetical protein
MNDVSRLIGALEVMAQSLTENDLLKASSPVQLEKKKYIILHRPKKI